MLATGRHDAQVQLLETHTSVPSSGMVKTYCALFILLLEPVTYWVKPVGSGGQAAVPMQAPVTQCLSLS